MARVELIGRDAGNERYQDQREHGPGYELPPPKEWMTLSEASARCGRSVHELKQAIRGGKLRADTDRSVWRIHRGDLKTYLLS